MFKSNPSYFFISYLTPWCRYYYYLFFTDALFQSFCDLPKEISGHIKFWIQSNSRICNSEHDSAHKGLCMEMVPFIKRLHKTAVQFFSEQEKEWAAKIWGSIEAGCSSSDFALNEREKGAKKDFDPFTLLRLTCFYLISSYIFMN